MMDDDGEVEEGEQVGESRRMQEVANPSKQPFSPRPLLLSTHYGAVMEDVFR
jgi:hypothetical protein